MQGKRVQEPTRQKSEEEPQDSGAEAKVVDITALLADWEQHSDVFVAARAARTGVVFASKR